MPEDNKEKEFFPAPDRGQEIERKPERIGLSETAVDPGLKTATTESQPIAHSDEGQAVLEVPQSHESEHESEQGNAVDLTEEAKQARLLEMVNEGIDIDNLREEMGEIENYSQS